MKTKSHISPNWNSLADDYGLFIHERVILGPALLKIFEKENIKKLRVADVGCGIGIYSKILVEQFGCEVFAYDLSPKMIGIAQSSFVNSKIHFQIANAKKLPLENQSVDIVLMSTLKMSLNNHAIMYLLIINL